MVGSPPMGHMARTSALPVMTHGAQISTADADHYLTRGFGWFRSIQCPASYGGES